MTQPSITWTKPKLERFKQAIAEARTNQEEVFDFEGHPFVLTYAHYLAQHLDSKLGGTHGKL